MGGFELCRDKVVEDGMNSAVSRRSLIALGGALALLVFPGCAASMRPLSSAPPRAKIVLPAPFTVTAIAGILPPLPYHVILPAGEYHPLYEDDQAYYFQAPSKLVINDFGSSLYDGGIYVLRGSTAPRGWYYIDRDGQQQFGRFDTPPPTR